MAVIVDLLTEDFHLHLSFPRHQIFLRGRSIEAMGYFDEDGNPQTQPAKSQCKVSFTPCETAITTNHALYTRMVFSIGI